MLFTVIVAVQSGIHQYIHLLEAGDEAGRAQPFAEKLAQLAPAASHLVRPYLLSNQCKAFQDCTHVCACRSPLNESTELS